MDRVAHDRWRAVDDRRSRVADLSAAMPDRARFRFDRERIPSDRVPKGSCRARIAIDREPAAFDRAKVISNRARIILARFGVTQNALREARSALDAGDDVLYTASDADLLGRAAGKPIRGVGGEGGGALEPMIRRVGPAPP